MKTWDGMFGILMYKRDLMSFCFVCVFGMYNENRSGYSPCFVKILY